MVRKQGDNTTLMIEGQHDIDLQGGFGTSRGEPSPGAAEYAAARRFLLGLPHAPPLDKAGKPAMWAVSKHAL